MGPIGAEGRVMYGVCMHDIKLREGSSVLLIHSPCMCACIVFQSLSAQLVLGRGFACGREYVILTVQMVAGILARCYHIISAGFERQ
jgi:hypothetical protein